RYIFAGKARRPSAYVPGTGGAFGVLSNEGEYATTTNSNLVHSNFASCGDHTGGGQMLVVNGSTTANESIWCQVVSVTPNTDHLFSSWLQSVISENPAVLQFSINGQLLGGTFSAPFASCNWQQFTETWNSGAATTAEICILNQNTQVSGNDFAIDDIFFGPVCEQSDEMIVEVIEVIAVVLDPDVQACTGNSLVTLDGSFSSAGPNIFYEWTTTNGNIVGPTTTPVIEVDEPGTYTLTVSYFNGSFQCSDVVTVVVPPTQSTVTAAALPPAEITCSNLAVTLDGSTSSGAPNLNFSWSTTNGHIVGNPNQAIIEVDQAGTYELEVTDPISGCSDIISLEVLGNTNPPIATALADSMINCQNGTVTLTGPNPTDQPN
ncbi:MAG: hypothetical protein AAFQ37_14890, partial [Bacteroidota bacterium]